MEQYTFTAYALGGEIDLNRLGVNLGVTKKYRWEEPMILNPVEYVSPTVQGCDSALVYLYYFGGVVFVNSPPELLHSFFTRMGEINDSFRGYPQIKYQDDYSLRIAESEKPAITNDYAVVSRYDPAFIDTVCFVIAKSVALERIEEQVDMVLDEVEGLISLLSRGKLGFSDRQLAQLASSILNFKYKSIAHIMVLDKPDFTWENQEADRLYLTMANLFELNQRYQEIKHKSETLLGITDVFTGLTHARRTARLEWIIIVLIFIEIVIYILEITWK